MSMKNNIPTNQPTSPESRVPSPSSGYVHSVETGGTVDGPGMRFVIFVTGCPLRCLYCHNPDTLAMKDGHPVTSDELLARIARYRGVFRATGGGITLSGGEVLMQPAFAARILRGAKELGIHTAIDTSGFLGAAATDAMLEDVDLVLLDVKSGDPDTYRRLSANAQARAGDFRLEAFQGKCSTLFAGMRHARQ